MDVYQIYSKDCIISKQQDHYLPLVPRTTRLIRNRTRKTKNNILAIDAAPAAIPVNPNTAAINARTKNMITHLNMITYF